MSERELVTVAFGNYSTLVAAQWANGTSVYDQHHHTLFAEKSASRVQGGSSQGSGIARVPRLLLFDAPHASNFEDVQDVAARLADEEAENEEDSEATTAGVVSSLLWRSPDAALTREEQQLQKLAQKLESQWWDRGEAQLDSSEDSQEDDEEEEDTADDQGHRTHGHRRPYREDGYQYSQLIPTADDDASGNNGGDEEQNRDGNGRDVPEALAAQNKPLTKHQLHHIKRRLFRLRDRTVPWWRYITTGLDRESVLALSPLHNVDGAGDIPLLHSVGFGLRTMTPAASRDVEQLCESLRRQVEEADHLQGLQTFVDGDSLFAGVAHNVLQAFWEDEGAKVPVALFTTFNALPPALTDPAMAAHIAFAERRQEEVWLNRLLATSCLSASNAALYVPVEMGRWEHLFAANSEADRGALTEWLEDDTATAQYLATVADTALYGLRDGCEKPPTHGDGGGGEEGDGNSTEVRTETHAARGRRGRRAPDLPPAVRESSGPVYYLDEWQRTVRPAPSMRVAALMGALPIRIAGNQQRDLWECLDATPLLGSSSSQEEGVAANGDWGRGFVPLTHAMTKPPSSEAGRVMGHAVTLRGPGVLPSQVYPTREALLRYALPLRTSTYLPLLTRTNYPLSSTFPMSLLFPKTDLARLEAQLPPGKQLRDAVVGVDAAAHTLSTFNSAPMLQEMVAKSESILRYKAHYFAASYGMERDDWEERLEDVKEIHDDYRHEDYIEDDNESAGNDDDW